MFLSVVLQKIEVGSHTIVKCRLGFSPSTVMHNIIIVHGNVTLISQ